MIIIYNSVGSKVQYIDTKITILVHLSLKFIDPNIALNPLSYNSYKINILKIIHTYIGCFKGLGITYWYVFLSSKTSTQLGGNNITYFHLKELYTPSTHMEYESCTMFIDAYC